MIIILLSFIASYNQPIWGIDNPLPVLLNHGEVYIHFRDEPVNKVRAKLGVGIWNSIILGVSYGGDNLVSYEDVDWEDQPSLDLRMRLFESEWVESVVGFNNEPIENFSGKDLFITAGFRLYVGSFRVLLCGGGNYNFTENRENGEKGVDIFANTVLNINGPHSIHAEYILGANDDNDNSKNRFNIGYRIQSGALGVELDIKNIFSGDLGRQIQIFYRENF